MKNTLIKIQRVVKCHKCIEIHPDNDDCTVFHECKVCHGEGLEFLNDTISVKEFLKLILELVLSR